MRSLPVVALHQEPADVLLCLRSAQVTQGRYLLCLEAAEQPLHGRIVPTVIPPAHALREAVAPEPLAKASTAILASLVAVKEHLARAPALLVRPVQGLDDQIGIGLGGKRPPHHATGKQVDYHGDVMPLVLCPDVGDVAAPHLVRGRNLEGSVQHVGYVWTLRGRPPVNRRARLLADQAHLAH